jgi:hypothetical protein
MEPAKARRFSSCDEGGAVCALLILFFVLLSVRPNTIFKFGASIVSI